MWYGKSAVSSGWAGVGVSVAGLLASIAASLHLISLVIGIIGASFGALAGFYTWRIQRHRWKQLAKSPSAPDQSRNVPVLLWFLIFGLGGLTSGCVGPLKSKPIELFQTRVPEFPQPSPRLAELQRAAALYIAEKAQTAQIIAATNPTTPPILQASVDQIALAARPLSESLGPPRQAWTDSEFSNSIHQIRRQLADYRGELQRFADRLEKIEGKPVEGTGKIQIPRSYLWWGVLLFLGILWIAWPLLLNLVSPPVATAVGTIARASAKTLARGVQQLTRGGQVFLQSLYRQHKTSYTPEEIEALFRAAHKAQQDEEVRQLIRQLLGPSPPPPPNSE